MSRIFVLVSIMWVSGSQIFIRGIEIATIVFNFNANLCAGKRQAGRIEHAVTIVCILRHF